MNCIAEIHKNHPYWTFGFGTGPASPAKFEIHGDDYTVSLFKDDSILGIHKDGRKIVSGPATNAIEICHKIATNFQEGIAIICVY